VPFGTGVRHLVREIVVWAFVLGAGLAGVYYFDEMRATFAHTMQAAVDTVASPESRQEDTSSGFERSVTLKANRNGHFYARANINGRSVAVLVDTGATGVFLSYDDAREIGITPNKSEYTIRTRTANGIGRAAPVTLDHVRIDSVEVCNVRGVIAEPGALHVTLLGMEFIRGLSRFELRGQELVLVE
jgi:aspartyl protease family protein